MRTIKPFQQYAAYGYYVARDAIPMPLVKAVSESYYQDAKSSGDPILRQSGQKEVSRFDSSGFITNPIVDPHLTDNPRLTRFGNAVLAATCSSEMLKLLSGITLEPQHVLQQVMVFEQSETKPHQDWVYLDSFPPGQLCAAWLALEDIHPSATRFFVIPGSQDVDCGEFTEEEIWSGAYTSAVTKLVETKLSDKVTIPKMQAGDVLFWNSRVIHGSLAGDDPTRSRLSLTAHYIPHGFGFGKRNNPVISAFPFDAVTNHPIAYIKK
jgi:phytanoyl-CoA hydroxylase